METTLMLESEKQFLKIIETQAPQGDVCEIGTGRGTSTEILASGGRKVVSIDPMPTTHEWRKLHKISENINYVMGYSSEYLFLVTGKVYSIVFIDGDHSFEAVKSDIQSSAGKIVDGGLLCFHDYGELPYPFSVRDELIKDWEINRHPGVAEAVNIALDTSQFKLFGRVGSLICFYKVAENGRDVTDLLADTLNNLPDFVRKDFNYADAIKELEQTCETIEPVALPMIYQLETTSKCNLSCPFCPRTTQLVPLQQRDMNVNMPLEDFTAVLDKMPWLKSIELFHFGEPFMQNNIHEYIKACKDRGIYVVIASNLIPATEKKLDLAFEAGLDFLVMDVDSLDKERYLSMRVNGNFEKLREMVLYILSKPKEKRPYCIAQTILLDGTPEYTEEEFLQWTGGLRADEVRYKFLDSFRETVVMKQGLGEDDLCREAFYGFTVHVNGNVVPCDRDWGGENVMGNIFTQGVQEIWQGDKFKAFRARMKSKDKPDMCKKCTEGKLVNMRSQPGIQVNMFKGNFLEHR